MRVEWKEGAMIPTEPSNRKIEAGLSERTNASQWSRDRATQPGNLTWRLVFGSSRRERARYRACQPFSFFSRFCLCVFRGKLPSAESEREGKKSLKCELRICL